MSTLWRTAEQLRVVQAAHRRFVTLWAINEASRLFDQQWQQRQDQLAASEPIDAHPHDWKALYRGSVLDD